MGYDMYWEREPAEGSDVRVPHEQARAAFHAAVRHRDRNGRDYDPIDQEAVIAALDATERAEFWYFGLNIWGMGVAREELLKAEVMVNVETPPWPEFNDENGDGLDLIRESVAPGDTHGIPIYKVGSNDGWLVTPGEITTGVGWADAHHPGWRDELTDYVALFVTWMERAAAEGGGFRVY